MSEFADLRPADYATLAATVSLMSIGVGVLYLVGLDILPTIVT